jgi:hypothetical protein
MNLEWCSDPLDTHAAAQGYFRQCGYTPLRLPPRSKAIFTEGWQQTHYESEEELDSAFPEEVPSNIGVLLGDGSAGRPLDADLDCREVRVLATRFLPPTRRISGRRSARRSHFWYRAAGGCGGRKEFKDPVADKDATIAELRGNGCQTVVPPSIHPEGEAYEWEEFGDPSEVEYDVLHKAVADLSAAALLARYWPGPESRKRQDTAMALTGGLLRAGWSPQLTTTFLDAVCVAAGDPDARQRVSVVAPAAVRLANQETLVGWPRLVELLGDKGDKIVGKVREWLGLRESRHEDNGQAEATDAAPDKLEPWAEPIPLHETPALPSFPLRELPDGLLDWVKGVARATQTPADLAAMLSLAHIGASLSHKFRVSIRTGWPEPVNIFTVTALDVGERKSAVFRAAMAPAYEHESEKRAEMAPLIAAAKAEHALLESRLKHLVGRAAKETDEPTREQLRNDAKEAGRELAKHSVPEEPQLLCDDISPEELARLLTLHGGKMLQAGPEGTAFEIAKGRYSKRPVFDVYLKGHSGDPLRTNRISRAREAEDDPALSAALAVQPDVIDGLATEASLKRRGFLARWLYAMAQSLVGHREIAAKPVAEDVALAYRQNLLSLWRLNGAVGEDGKPAPNWLRFSTAADQAMQDFERWLEPQLARGEELSLLGGWANKLAGAIARLAAILHMATAAGGAAGWQHEIGESVVRSAIRIGRNYLLPHARAAFALMGADEKLEMAQAVWENLCRSISAGSEYSEYSESAPPTVTRRDIHQQNRRQFVTARDLDPVLEILVDRGFLRPVADSGQSGRGHASPQYRVNPLALKKFQESGGALTALTVLTSSLAQAQHSEREPGEEG